MNSLVQNYRKQTNSGIPQQINFNGRLEEDNDTTLFVSLESSEKFLSRFIKRNRMA